VTLERVYAAFLISESTERLRNMRPDKKVRSFHQMFTLLM